MSASFLIQNQSRAQLYASEKQKNWLALMMTGRDAGSVCHYCIGVAVERTSVRPRWYPFNMAD